jgi:hypothetical protein
MDRSKLPKEVQEKVAELNKAIFMQEGDRAAEIYQTILRNAPDFLLREPVQYDLARLLENTRQDELSLAAYKLLIKHQRQHQAIVPALRAAGTLAFKLKQYDDCVDFLHAFLENGPARQEKIEVEDLLSRLPPDAAHKVRMVSSTDHIKVEHLPGPDSTPATPPAPKRDRNDPNNSSISVEWKIMKTPTPVQRKAVPGPEALPASLDIWAEAKPVSNEPTPGSGEMRAPRRPAPPAPPAGIELGLELPPTPPMRPAVQPQQQQLPPTPYPPMQSPVYTPQPVAMPPGYYPGYPPQMGQPYYPQPGPGFMITPIPGYPHQMPPGYPGMTPQGMPPGAVYPGQQPPMTGQPVPVAPPAPPQPPAPVAAVPVAPGPMTTPEVKSFPPKPALTPSKRFAPPEKETAEERYHRLRDAQFALVLPVGKKIHLDSVAEFVAKKENIDPQIAKKKVLRRKGLLYDQLTLHEVLDLQPLVVQCRQSLVFVAVPRELRPYEHIEVFSAEVRDQGLKLNIGSTVKRIRWDDIQLVNCGRIGSDSFATILGSEPMKEYRFSLKSFDFTAVLPTQADDKLPVLHEFLQMISKRAPEAVLSHTTQALFKERSSEPQPFGNAEEFASYTLWMLFSHRAEIVDSKELAQLSHVTSNW